MAPARLALVLAAPLTVLACGIPQSQYDAALKDAHDAHAQLDKCKSDASKGSEDLASENKRLREELAIAEAKENKNGAMSEEERQRLEELRKEKEEAEARAKQLDEFAKKFKAMIDAGKLKIVVRHGRLVLQLKNEVLFNAASAELRPAGKDALKEIGATLKTISGRRFQIAGHTDIVPIKSKEFPSNWELSTQRALNVLNFLIAQGVNPGTLSAAGYGPYDPVASNNSAYGQALNRRIEITLQPDLGKLVPPQEPPKN